MNKKKGSLLAVFGVLSMILITAGVTYAFFNYSKSGTTTNAITTGSIELHYDEVSKKGQGIKIEDALPVASNQSAQSSNDYFTFTITGKTSGSPISYVVTARKDSTSTLDEDVVEVYLTDATSTETAVFDGMHTYDDLIQYANAPAGTVEKVIYTETIAANTASYSKTFKLRMWIDEAVDFSGVVTTPEGCNDPTMTSKTTCTGTYDDDNNPSTPAVNRVWTDEVRTYPYNDETFKITVNVYSDSTITGYTPRVALSIDNTETSLASGNTLTLSVTNQTSNTVTYESSDTSVATVDATGVVTAVSAGQVTITAKAGLKTATKTLTVTGS